MRGAAQQQQTNGSLARRVLRRRRPAANEDSLNTEKSSTTTTPGTSTFLLPLIPPACHCETINWTASAAVALFLPSPCAASADMPRLCRLLHRELQKIACLATVHYQLTYCCCPAAIPNAGNAGRREHGRPARESVERAPVSYLEPTKPNTRRALDDDGSVPFESIVSTERRRHAMMPVCFCVPLYVFILLSLSDVSSPTARVSQSSACSAWFDRRRDARAAKHPHEACLLQTVV